MKARVMLYPASLHRALHWIAQRPLPIWATPLALANLANLVVQSLDHHYIRTHQILALTITGSLAALLVTLYIALTRDPRRYTTLGRRLITVTLMVVLAGNTVLHLVLVLPHLEQDARYTNDAVAVTDCAAREYVAGEDPYRNVHMLSCLERHRLGASATTPKQAGAFKKFRTYPSPASVTFAWQQYITYENDLRRELRNPRYVTPDFESRFNYPGGALLLAIPALVLALRDLVPLYLGCTILASILIYRRAAPHIRPAVGLLLLGDTPLLLDGVGGLTDAAYALMLVLYWFYRRRPVVAGLLLGLAAATRQQVWFFIPFLLILAWRDGGWADLRKRASLAAAMFLTCNLPFIVMGPSDWVAGVLGPVRDPLFALGVGLITLPIAKILPLWPAATYLKLEVAAYALCLWHFLRRGPATPALALLLPLIPMALAWRSLHTYFMFLPLLAAAALVDPDPAPERPAPPIERPRRPLRWRLRSGPVPAPR